MKISHLFIPIFMIRYSRSKFVAILILIQFCLLSCVTADREFGNDMIPPNQIMNTFVDSSSIAPRTYIDTTKGIVTSRTGLNSLPLGSYIDPLVGRTNIQVFSNYRPSGFEFGSTTFFGDEPVIDSMYLLFNLTSYKGDTVKGLDISIYEVKTGKYQYYKNFYSDYKMKEHLDKEPILTFHVKSPDIYRKRLPMEFAQKFLINDHNTQNPYYNDTVFQSVFKGLYFTTNQVTDGEGCIYNFDLSTSTMQLFYHTVRDNKKDTSTLKMLMFGNSDAPYNTHFLTAQHDYKYANPDKGGVLIKEIGDSTIQTKRGYVNAPAGLNTMIEFPKEQIDLLQKKAVTLGYQYIGVHNAILTLYVENPVWQNYDKMYKELAAYLSFSTYSVIPDYQSVTMTEEAIGSLNRSVGIYRLDITSYMQRLIAGKVTKNKLELAPSVSQYLSPMRSVIKGSASDQPPKVTLTYTLLK